MIEIDRYRYLTLLLRPGPGVRVQLQVHGDILYVAPKKGKIDRNGRFEKNVVACALRLFSPAFFNGFKSTTGVRPTDLQSMQVTAVHLGIVVAHVSVNQLLTTSGRVSATPGCEVAALTGSVCK